MLMEDAAGNIWEGDPQYTSALPTSSTNLGGALFTPTAANPGATNWDDVLKFGFARAIDAATRAVSPTNAVPVVRPLGAQSLGAPVAAGSGMMLLLVVGGLFLLMK